MLAIGISRRNQIRAVLLFGIAVGLIALLYLLTISNVDTGAAFRAYHYAASASLAGEPFYGISAPGYDSTFIYPPVTILFFYPFALIENWRLSFALMTFLNIVLAIGIAKNVIWFIEIIGESPPRADRILIVVYSVFSVLTIQVYLQGQINSFLALAVIYGFVRLYQDDEHSAGILFALAALFKYFPALFGIYLIKRRAYRGIAAAILTGTGFLGLGYLLFGHGVYKNYLQNVLSSRYIFADGLSPTVNLVTFWRPLSYLLPEAGPPIYLLVSAGIMAPILIYVYLRSTTAVGELIAILVTSIMIIVVLPSKLPYLVMLHFPLVPLLYLVEDRTVHQTLLVGSVVVCLAFNLEHVRAVAQIVITSEPIRAAILRGVEPLFTVATPPLYGLVILLVACLRYAYCVGGDSEGCVSKRLNR
ncbi:DUF2029 domain-containing protein [Halorubrum sp. SS5]|nr:DUF2029 domain-containing protein [Halorubrum sp. SS5]